MSEQLLNKSIDMIFKYKDTSLRILGTFDEPLFIAKEICDILELTNSRMVLKNIPEQWKRKDAIETNGGAQDTNLITEHGLYFIVMRSDKPVARPFQLWLCGEVIPSLRRTGTYKMNEEYQKLLKEVEVAKKVIEQKNKIIENKDKTITSNGEIIESLQQKFQDSHDYRFKELGKGKDKRMRQHIILSHEIQEARQKIAKLKFEARCFAKHNKTEELERANREIAILCDRYNIK